MNITEAKTAYAGRVIIWNNHRHGSSPADRYLWLAEKDGGVIDYNRKDVLIEQALADGDQVVVLTVHRGGQVSAKEIHPAGRK